MKMSECVYGKLVKRNNECSLLVGMVVGISENMYKEPVPLVQWQTGSTWPVHPILLIAYEE